MDLGIVEVLGWSPKVYCNEVLLSFVFLKFCEKLNKNLKNVCKLAGELQ